MLPTIGVFPAGLLSHVLGRSRGLYSLFVVNLEGPLERPIKVDTTHQRSYRRALRPAGDLFGVTFDPRGRDAARKRGGRGRGGEGERERGAGNKPPLALSRVVERAREGGGEPARKTARESNRE